MKLYKRYIIDDKKHNNKKFNYIEVNNLNGKQQHNLLLFLNNK